MKYSLLLKLIALMVFVFVLYYSSPSYSGYASLSKEEYHPECNFKIEMSLDKYEYKKYEPVIAKFKVINNDAKSMNIYNLFNPEMHETNINVKDNLGNSWSFNKIIIDPNYIKKPSYTIKPGDTLIVSMPINNWGESYEDTLDISLNTFYNKWYLEQFGYFPSNRNYKAILHFDKQNEAEYGCELKSNEVDFKVNNLETEDEAVLKLYMDVMRKFNYKELDDVLSKYPNNTLTEYVNAEYLYAKWFRNQTDTTLKDYQDFFNKYPNSLYLYNHKFLTPYFNKLKADKINKSKAYEVITNDRVKQSIKWFLK